MFLLTSPFPAYQLSWEDTENAIRQWVKLASGLDDQHVIWSDQSGPRPTAGHITISIGDTTQVGAVDELQALTDLGRPAGQEIELQVTGLRVMGISIQAFTPKVTGFDCARALLSRVQTGAMLPSIRAVLDSVDVSVFDSGTVRSIPALLGTKFEGRGVLDCRAYVVEQISEFTTFIEKVETTSYMGPPGLGTRDSIDI